MSFSSASLNKCNSVHERAVEMDLETSSGVVVYDVWENAVLCRILYDIDSSPVGGQCVIFKHSFEIDNERTCFQFTPIFPWASLMDF